MTQRMRCPVYHRSGLQCERFEGHEGRHQHVEHIITNWDTDQRERNRLELDKVPEVARQIARAMIGDITTSDEQIEEALFQEHAFPQDATAAASALGDNCPRCGGQLEQHEGLERDYPSCPRCR